MALSLLLHLLFLGIVHFDKKEKPEEKPIEVSIVPKEKKAPAPLPSPAPEPQPQPKSPPQKNYKDMPLDEDIPTELKKQAPALKERRSSEKPSEKQTPGKKGEDKKTVPQEKRAEPKAQDKDAVLEKKDKTELPKISSKTEQQLREERQAAEKKRLDDIMNPRDTIEKYAKGEGPVTGEDSVSMQYVKMKYQSYFHKFARMLYQVWQYPVAAGMRGEQGLVQASFVISKDGKISSIRILQSSGYPDLDNEVLYALKHMSAVPLPESYDLEFLKVDAYFKYIINTSHITIY
ncbi:MAG: energy transducer TonB [Deferribacterales bacterium]